MLDWGRRELLRDMNVLPDPLALHPLHRLILSLPDEREALTPVLVDQAPDRVKLADLAAPAVVDGRRAVPLKLAPERLHIGDPENSKSIAFRYGLHILIGLGELKPRIGKERRDRTEGFLYEEQRCEAIFSAGVRDCGLPGVLFCNIPYELDARGFVLRKDLFVCPNSILPCRFSRNADRWDIFAGPDNSPTLHRRGGGGVDSRPAHADTLSGPRRG